MRFRASDWTIFWLFHACNCSGRTLVFNQIIYYLIALFFLATLTYVYNRPKIGYEFSGWNDIVGMDRMTSVPVGLRTSSASMADNCSAKYYDTFLEDTVLCTNKTIFIILLVGYPKISNVAILI